MDQDVAVMHGQGQNPDDVDKAKNPLQDQELMGLDIIQE